MKNYFKIFKKPKVILLLILIFAAAIRIYGLNWDQGQHLHPDERFLTMVLNDIKIPSSLGEYFNPKTSSLNPYNKGYSFFVYGAFPLNLTKVIGVITSNNDYSNIHFVGRLLSAFFDIGVVLLLFKSGQKLFNEKTGLLASFLYSILVLPIQLSHFFAVDTFLNFFLVLSFYLLVLMFKKQKLSYSIFLGISFGLGLTSKISALYFLPIIGLGFVFLFLKNKKLKLLTASCLLFTVCTILTFRLNQPQAFATGNFFNWQPNPQFISNLKQLKSFDDPNAMFPPALQWKSTAPIIFPLKNMISWGMGLPLGIISFTAVFYAVIQLFNSLVNKKNKFNIPNLLIVLWILGLFLYQGSQFVKTMRYFLPIYPFLSLLSAKFLFDFLIYLGKKHPKLLITCCLLLVTLLLIYPLSFMNIYTKPITRVTASEWIYDNIPQGSIILNEEWDDSLPLYLPNESPQNYTGSSVFMYDPDSVLKWQKLTPIIQKADYIFLTSNRAYGSTMKLPKLFSQTIKYYKSLFEGSGNFKKVAEFVSYPCFPPGKYNLFCFNDDLAEEAFTVYDHPKVMIFKKK